MIPDDPDTWFGFTGVLFLLKNGALGSSGGFPSPCGLYYTGVGYKNVGSVARKIVEDHIDICLDVAGSTSRASTPRWRRASEFQIYKGLKRRGRPDGWPAIS